VKELLRLLALLAFVGLTVASTRAWTRSRLDDVVAQQARRSGADLNIRSTADRARAAADRRMRRLAASTRPEDRDALRAAATGSDPVARLEALQELSDHPVAGDEAALRASFNHGDADMALIARRGLVRLGRVDEVYPSLVAYAGTGVPALSALALRAPPRGPSDYHPRALDYCLAVTSTASFAVRVEAGDGLLLFGRTEEGLRVFDAMLRSKVIDERLTAVTALAEHLAVPGVRALLEAHRDDPEEFVRTAVADALAGKPQ
jgi:hypothetical protein